MSVSYASSRCCSQLLKVAHRTPLLLYFFSHVRSSALSPQHLVLDWIWRWLLYMIFFYCTRNLFNHNRFELFKSQRTSLDFISRGVTRTGRIGWAGLRAYGRVTIVTEWWETRKGLKSLDRFSAEDTNKKRIQVARHLNQDHLKLIQADQTNETNKKIDNFTRFYNIYRFSTIN